MTHNEWRERYNRLATIADRIVEARRRRARKLCAEAGLDPNLLGIHPHNAMVGLRAGKPWRGIDYSKVRACIRISKMPSPHEIVTRWDRRIRRAG